jgi:hypothetical protein
MGRVTNANATNKKMATFNIALVTTIAIEGKLPGQSADDIALVTPLAIEGERGRG